MKVLASLLVLLASSVALAYPAVGDSSVMSGSAIFNGQEASLSIERTIAGFDVAANEYLLIETQTVDGQAQTNSSNTAAADLITQEQVNQILSFCAMFGGTAESITVTAGDFATCKLPTKDENGQPDGGFAWVGDVAFGIVKVTGIHEGAEYVLELQSHVFGK